MNPNDLIDQQQAILNQTIQTQQHWAWGVLAIQIAFLLIGVWIVYMFYARLRDIAEELMKLRIAYEFANSRKSDGNRPAILGETPANPFQGSNPKSS
jgi:hypothetical protein